jgi:UPF0755 protein
MLDQKEYSYVLVHTGTSYSELLDQLAKENVISNSLSFDWVARAMKLDHSVKPGRYRIRDKMSNRELVTLLRSGRQEPVDLVLRPFNNLPALASFIGRNLEADSNEFLRLIQSDSLLKATGFSSETIMAMFIPNTYTFYWNSSAAAVVRRLNKEYNNFWTVEKRLMADSIHLNPVQVSTLASIVEKETQKRDEMPVVAGVYINRLRSGQMLQADPTVIFAAARPGVHRVTEELLRIESPYNTYLHKGLPPGPICIPSVAAIESVLNYNRHKYIYFCAKEDLSGYHNFACSWQEHLQNARKYQRMLNSRKIYK